MTIVLLLLLVVGSTSFPTDISKEAAENFLGSGQRTPEELKRLKENLQRLNKRTRKDLNAHSRGKKRNLVLYSHDEEPPHSVPAPKLPSDETTINDKLPVREYLYQGDMALTAHQVEERLRSRLSRAAIHDSSFPNTKWDSNKVPYYFDPSLPTKTRTRVREAMDYIEKYTCVRFVEDQRAEPRVKIFRGSGCWTYVGRQHTWKTQELSLGSNCDNHLGVMAHELMHVLGFYHEQARTDRDDFITINPYNIDPNNTNQFTKEKDSDTQNFPYEYGSVMHYASSLYAKDSSIPVFVAKDPLYSTTMGQRMKPSFQDLQQINDLYKCWVPCDTSGTECGNGGIANVNDCKTCFCPYGFTGKYCFDLEKPTARNPGCGEIVQAEPGVWKKISGSVTSGMESNSEWLVTPESCWWHIKAPPEKRIAARVTKLNVVDCDSSCAFSHLEIKTGNFKMTGYRLCCSEQRNIVFNSTLRTMAIGVNVRLYTTSFELEYTAF